MASQPDAINLRQKSDGSEISTQRAEKTETSKRRVKSMVSLSTDPSDQEAMGKAVNGCQGIEGKPPLRPQTDSVVYKNWKAAEDQLKAVLTPEMSEAVSRLASYCHKVEPRAGQGTDFAGQGN